MGVFSFAFGIFSFYLSLSGARLLSGILVYRSGGLGMCHLMQWGHCCSWHTEMIIFLRERAKAIGELFGAGLGWFS